MAAWPLAESLEVDRHLAPHSQTAPGSVADADNRCSQIRVTVTGRLDTAFTKELVTRTKSLNRPRCLSVEEWIKKM